MTTKQTAKLQALREEADLHGDTATVALVDAALAGDVKAAARLGVAAKAAKAVATGSAAKAPRARRSPFATPVRDTVHPWAQDEE